MTSNEFQPTLDNHLSPCGIPIEHIISHIQPSSVALFLETLKRVIEKWRESESKSSLVWRVERIATSYRVFEKFERVLGRVFGESSNGENSCNGEGNRGEMKEDVQGIVWVLYVMAKETINRDMQVHEQVRVLEKCVEVVVGGNGQFQREFPKDVGTVMEEELPVVEVLDRVLGLRDHNTK